MQVLLMPGAWTVTLVVCWNEVKTFYRDINITKSPFSRRPTVRLPTDVWDT